MAKWTTLYTSWQKNMECCWVSRFLGIYCTSSQMLERAWKYRSRVCRKYGVPLGKPFSRNIDVYTHTHCSKDQLNIQVDRWTHRCLLICTDKAFRKVYSVIYSLQKSSIFSYWKVYLVIVLLGILNPIQNSSKMPFSLWSCFLQDPFLFPRTFFLHDFFFFKTGDKY